MYRSATAAKHLMNNTSLLALLTKLVSGINWAGYACSRYSSSSKMKEQCQVVNCLTYLHPSCGVIVSSTKDSWILHVRKMEICCMVSIPITILLPTPTHDFISKVHDPCITVGSIQSLVIGAWDWVLLQDLFPWLFTPHFCLSLIFFLSLFDPLILSIHKKNILPSHI